MSRNAILHPSVTPASEAPADLTVAAAQRGDRAAFGALYDAHAGRVYALCVGLAGNRRDADELVQDVFVRVWEQLASFRGDCAFGTWLHRVAVNTVLTAKRRDGRRSLRVAIASDLAGERSHERSREPSQVPPTDRAAGRSHDAGLAMDLEWAIGQLPDGARGVFVLHDVQGFQHAEIAEQLGIAVGTSKAHLFRARRLLRELLDS